MKETATKRGFAFLSELINTRCKEEAFLKKSKISRERFRRLTSGKAEMSQDEMLRTAAILQLTEAEFMRCFFNG